MKKKASVLLLSLMCMIMIFVLAAVFINIAIAFETVQRTQETVEEAARVRAQAVDIPLKEQEGVVEVLHRPYGGTDADLDYDHMSVVQKEGHVKPQHPDEYAPYVTKADDIAIKAAMDQLQMSLKNTVDGDTIMKNLSPDNFCFDIRPLPEGKEGVVDFSCIANLDGESVKIEQSILISGRDKNTYDETGVNIGVQNVVFAGFAFEYKHFIYKALEEIGISGTHKGEVSAIAYPQVDLCTRAADSGC